MYILANGEALGPLTTLQWIYELRLGRIDFELDSKKVVDSFVANRRDWKEFEAIINDCKILFSQIYENLSGGFVRRQTNEVAYKSLKATTLLTNFYILVNPPNYIERVLINEMYKFSP